MGRSTDQSKEAAAEIAARAAKVGALAQQIVREGEGFVPRERRGQLNALRDALIEAERLLEAAAQEAGSARAVLLAARQDTPESAWVPRYVPSAEDIARVNAVLEERTNPAVLAELVRQFEKRRSEAAAIGQTLVAELAELRDLDADDKESARRSIELLAQRLNDRDAIRDWLSIEHPDLGGRTPLQVIREGHGDAVETMLANAADGIPT